MPPKKAKGAGKKKKAAAPVKKDTDLTLPPITTVRTSGIMFAVASSDVVTMGRLVQHFNFASMLSKVDMNNSMPLHMASKRGDAAIVEKLLSYKETLTTVDARESSSVGGYAAIHYACAGNYYDVLSLLLTHKADVNIKTASTLGESPLHVCCKTGPSTMACAKLLIDAGANVNATDTFGHNCSYWAQNKGHVDMIRELNLPDGKACGIDEFIAMTFAAIPGFSIKKDKKKKPAGKGKGKK